MDIATPVSFGGFTQGAIEFFAPQLRALGLEPRQGMTGGGRLEPGLGNPASLQPGSMISVQLLTGDMSVGADGTVTYIDGRRVYAFGHRFLSIGTTEIPFARADVLALVPNLATSFKISAPREWMGTISEDRSTGVAGELGRRAAMMPVSISVAHPAGRGSAGARSTYRMEMVNDRFLSPLLLQMAVFSAIDATERTVGASTLVIRGEIQFQGNSAPIRLNNTYSGEASLPQQASLGAAVPLAYALQSDFDALRLKNVRIEIDSYDERKQMQIDQVWTSRREVQPGDSLDLTVVLAGPNGVERSHKVTYRVPVGAPTGTLYFTVADGTTTNLHRVPADSDDQSQNAVSVGDLSECAARQHQGVRARLAGGSGLRCPGPEPSRSPAIGGADSGTDSDGPGGRRALPQLEGRRVGDRRGRHGDFGLEDRAGGDQRMKHGLFFLPLTLLAAAAFSAGTATWEMNNYRDFVRGRFAGVSLSRDGRLRLAPKVETVLSSDQPVIWSVAQARDGTLYAGTGHRGRVFRIDKSGKSSVAVDRGPARGIRRGRRSQGGACTPPPLPTARSIASRTGRPPSSSRRRSPTSGLWRSPRTARCSWAPAIKASSFAWTPPGKGEVYYETGQSHVTCLAFDAQGRLLAGTEPNGIIYRIEARNRAFVLYDTNLPEIRAITSSPDGVHLRGGAGRREHAARPGRITRCLRLSPAPLRSPAPATTVTVTDEAAQGGIDLKPKPEAPSPPSQRATPQVTAQFAPVSDFAGVEKSALYKISPDNTVETLWSSKDENVYDLADVRRSDCFFDRRPWAALPAGARREGDPAGPDQRGRGHAAAPERRTAFWRPPAIWGRSSGWSRTRGPAAVMNRRCMTPGRWRAGAA